MALRSHILIYSLFLHRISSFTPTDVVLGPSHPRIASPIAFNSQILTLESICYCRLCLPALQGSMLMCGQGFKITTTAQFGVLCADWGWTRLIITGSALARLGTGEHLGYLIVSKIVLRYLS